LIQNVSKDYFYIEKAANREFSPAQLEFSELLFGQWIWFRNSSLAIHYLTLAATAGDAIAQEKLGKHYSWKWNKNRTLSLFYDEQAAAQGRVRSQLRLSEALWKGKSIPRNRTCGLELYEKAIASGSGGAAFSLAETLRKSKSNKEEFRVSESLYKAAAEKGDSDAFEPFAYLLWELGEKEKAIKYYNRATNAWKGSGRAEFKFAIIYAKGDGVAFDPIEGAVIRKGGSGMGSCEGCEILQSRTKQLWTKSGASECCLSQNP
jgi:TPR repeat protein